MAMLNLFCGKMLESNFSNLQIQVVHFNHRQRSEDEAFRESHLVRTACEKANIPFFYRTWPGKSPPLDLNVSHCGFQEKARFWRRTECLHIIKQECKHSHQTGNNNPLWCIVTAHHRDDRLETVLMKLLRGSHLSGLAPVIMIITL